MIHSELFKLHELKGRLQGRAVCLESDIRATEDLIRRLETEAYEAYFRGKLNTLEEWARSNARLLVEVERIIEEAENDRE